jgi:ArsR family transcriptional regulator
MDTTQLVKIAKALADPTRQKMLRQIRTGGEVNCSQICDNFDLSQPTISHHLKMLAAAGLIRCRKEGQFHVMSADEDVLRTFAETIVSGDPRQSRSPRCLPKRKSTARKP